jgi:hypothetical protein
MPVKLRVCQMPYGDKKKKLRMLGDSQEKEDCFIIRISNDETIYQQKDTLMHEWAHCMAGWDDDNDSHSDEWGICFAEIYRKFIGD